MDNSDEAEQFFRLSTAEYNKKYNTAFLQGLADTRFMVLENRYDGDADNPQGMWTLNVVFNTTPDAINSEGSFIATRMLGDGVMRFEEATLILNALLVNAPLHRFNNLDEATRNYISHRIAPIEWQAALDRGDPETMARLIVFGYDTPSMPDDLEKKDQEFWSGDQRKRT